MTEDPELLIRTSTGTTEVLCSIPIGYSRTVTIGASDARTFTATLGDKLQLPEQRGGKFDLILDILRANDLHQRHCAKRQIDEANRRGGMYWNSKPCNCWLAEESSQARVEIHGEGDPVRAFNAAGEQTFPPP